MLKLKVAITSIIISLRLLKVIAHCKTFGRVFQSRKSWPASINTRELSYDQICSYHWCDYPQNQN
ncbi:MAG: hypothetical protein CVV42_14295 [Candidatus Riflebacteria bacterium HGW-Riflebacteria-2]|nr:MAG: hypothetical protein CVV42_14295 [Candidatus Riflebacteria bacterium HGW-Riflebacteria-2]